MWFLADFETVKHFARSIIKITLILVSLDLVKVFIRKKSLGFSKSCRQRVIFAVLVLFLPEFAVCRPFPCGCLVESLGLVFRGPRCLVFVQLDPDLPRSPSFWNKVYNTLPTLTMAARAKTKISGKAICSSHQRALSRFGARLRILNLIAWLC